MSLVKGSRFQRYHVQPHHPIKKWLWRGSLILLVITAILSAYLYGSANKEGNRTQWLLDRIEFDKNRASLADQLLKANDKIALLTEQLQLQQQAFLIDQQQIQQLQEEAAHQLGEMHELNKQLSFYQSVMAPSAEKASLSVEQVSVSGQILAFTIKQSSANPLKVEGEIQVDLFGQLAGESERISLRTIPAAGADPKETIAFGFRFFQAFQLAVDSPEGFEASHITITVKNKKNKQLSIQQKFAWQQIQSK